MDQGVTAQRAIRDWHDLVGEIEAELVAGRFGLPEQATAVHARHAIATARAALDDLQCKCALAQQEHGDAAAGQGEPPSAIRRAKRARDALLRLGVCRELGRWGCIMNNRPSDQHRRDLVGLIIAFSRIRPSVPPGVAPTPSYAGTAQAEAFFTDGLRRALKLLAHRYDEFGAAFGELGEVACMDRTVAGAQRISGLWTLVACAVFVDWLARRSAGSGIDAACRNLWQYGEKDCPVQFRSPEGMAVLPTADRHMQLDLWTQWVLAQVLAHDSRRWAAAGVDGRWHPVRLHLRDFAGKAESGRDGSGRLHSGLSIGMVYQALVIDRIADVARATPRKEAIMGIEHIAQAPGETEIALPAYCAGQRLTMRVVWEWRADDALRAGASARFAPGQRRHDPGISLDAAYQRWHGGQLERRRERDRGIGIRTLDNLRLGFVPDDGVPASPADLLASIGHVDLSQLLHDEPLWIDVAAAAWQGGRWFDLHLQLVEAELDGAQRNWLAVDAEQASMLADCGLSLAALRSALADPQRSLWVWRADGVGVFLSIGLDLAAH